MTYKEITDRLTKCEKTLTLIKNGEYENNSNIDIQATTSKLEVLKESLIKQLKESEETMFVSTKGGETKAVQMSRKQAMDLKKDSNVTSIDTAKGQSLKEGGVEFTLDETKAIAKQVGKAVAKSLKDLGDELSTMKAKRIEPNSFEIYVEYKKDTKTDEFSFYITDDTLHLTDFSFDKELVGVGVKPSGEAIVHVDHLSNELTKHFKSLNEDEEEDAKNDADYERGWTDDPRMDEAPDDMYYIKIPKDAASQNKAQVIFNDLYGIKYELNDDPNGVIMYFKKEDFNPGILDDLEGDGVQILDTNIEEGIKEGEVDKEADRGDLDVGHQDDEPNMLKSSAFETAEYAAKLVKKLQRYDQHDGEVDFPNWWQKKLILARDYMSAAFHYLDSQEKQPAIDQLALENVDKVAGGIPYKREGNKFIITEPLDDATKERIISRAKEHGHHAAPNQAGGVTITQKGGINERLNGDQQEALRDLQNILDQAAQLGDEARSIIQDTFPEELRGAEAYDVFNFGSSSNSYDNTLESLISDIERRFSEDEGDDDLDEVVEDGSPGTDAYYEIRALIQKHARNLSDDDAYTMHELLKDFFNRYVEEGKYKSDAQRKAIHAKKAELKEGATCCGRCGRVHVKGSGCKRPYLKGKSHCRNK